VLRRVLGPEREEVTKEWRRLRNKELYALYSLNTIRVIRSRRLKIGRTCCMYGKGVVLTGF
jgi:hypothetical protein